MRVESKEQGFVIDSLQLRGFMRYLSPQSIRFGEKFTVITGRTGTGKTSLLDAITFALYNQTSRTDMQAIKISDVCRNGGHVKLSFFQRGERYEVERGLTLKGGSYLSLHKDGINVPGNISELNAVIEDVVGLDYTGFRNSTFVRQDEMKELGAESPAKRLDIFRKLFRLDVFQKAQDSVKDELSVIEKDIRSGDAKVEVHTENLKKLPELVDELDSLGKDLRSHEIEREGCAEDIEVLKGKLEELEKQHEKFLRIQDRMQKLEDDLEGLETRISSEQQKLESHKDLGTELQELEKGVKGLEEHKREEELLREKSNEHAKIAIKLEHIKDRLRELNERHDGKLEELNRRLDEQEERLNALTTDIGSEEAFDLLRTEGGLTERLERIEKELVWIKDKKIQKEIKGEKVDTARTLEKIKKRTSGINKDSFVRTEISEIIAQIRTDLKDEDEVYRNRKDELDKLNAEAQDKIQTLGFDESSEKRLEILKEEIKRIDAQRNRLDELRKLTEDLKATSRLVDELGKQVKEKEEELKKVSGLVKELGPYEKDYASAKDKLESLRNELRRLEKLVGEKGGEIKRVEERLENLETQKEELDRIEEKVKELRANKEVLSILKNDVFHNRGIVMYAINQILPQLSVEASNNLSALSAGRFNRVKLESLEVGARYGIGIMIEGHDGSWHDVWGFSGGEKTQINAALRFSIAKELALLPQVGRTYGRMRTLFIDEGDLGSLDTEVSRGLFVKKLFDIGEFFDKIILITHLTEVADMFPGKIRIEMSAENESKIIMDDGGGEYEA